MQYLQKSMGDEVDFLPANKHGSFLQDGSFTFDVHSQAWPKYPVQQVCNILAISQGKHEGWSLFFCQQIHVRGFCFIDTIILGVCVARYADKHQNLLQVDIVILGEFN